MHIEVPFESKDTAMSSKFWSKVIRVSGWHFRYNHHDYYHKMNWEID